MVMKGRFTTKIHITYEESLVLDNGSNRRAEQERLRVL